MKQGTQGDAVWHRPSRGRSSAICWASRMTRTTRMPRAFGVEARTALSLSFIAICCFGSTQRFREEISLGPLGPMTSPWVTRRLPHACLASDGPRGNRRAPRAVDSYLVKSFLPSPTSHPSRFDAGPPVTRRSPSVPVAEHDRTYGWIRPER